MSVYKKATLASKSSPPPSKSKQKLHSIVRDSQRNVQFHADSNESSPPPLKIPNTKIPFLFDESEKTKKRTTIEQQKVWAEVERFSQMTQMEQPRPVIVSSIGPFGPAPILKYPSASLVKPLNGRPPSGPKPYGSGMISEDVSVTTSSSASHIQLNPSAVSTSLIREDSGKIVISISGSSGTNDKESVMMSKTGNFPHHTTPHREELRNSVNFICKF